MNSNEQVLHNMARIARSGREFFADVYPRVLSPEVRQAFAYITDVKTRLLRDLQPWVPQIEAQDDDRTSPAALVQKMYSDAHRAFRSDISATVANALGFAEAQLCKLLQRAFDEADSPALKQVLKSYYAELLICRQAMWRLHARLAA
jgi:uncharacterized protein (TIGR02284 family)